MGKYSVEYRINKPMGGVQLTGGALKDAFENNVNFLKKFDMDRMLYWYRVHKGKPAPGVPYAGDAGHFENNLKGQTAGEFMMGAGTALLWQEDETLRAMVQGLIAEMDECRDEDGFIIPIPREQFDTKEYPNYTRAWITFGLLDAGAAVTLNRDDPTFLDGLTLTEELCRASSFGAMTGEELLNCQRTAVCAAFCGEETKAALLAALADFEARL